MRFFLARTVFICTLLLAFLAAGSVAQAEEQKLTVGGTIEFSFGDADLTAEPGPDFGTYKYGSAAKLSLFMRNPKVVAGMSVELPQGTKNIEYVDLSDNPLDDGDLDGSPLRVSSAFIRFRNIFDVMEMNLDVEGSTLGLGDMVKSTKSTRSASRTGIGFNLIPGTLGDLVLDLVVNQAPGTPPTPVMPAVRAFWGAQARLGWDAEMFSVYATALTFDADEADSTWAAGLNGSLSANLGSDDGPALTARGELNAVAGTADASGLGSGLYTSLDWKGLGLSGNLLWKNGNFGKDGKIFLITDVASDFGSWPGQALAVSGTLSVNPALLVGFDNLTVHGTYGKVLEGSSRHGWSAGADLNFTKLLGTNANLGFVLGRYGTQTEAPFINGELLWKLSAAYDYHGVMLTAWYGLQAYDDPAIPEHEQSARPAFEIKAAIAF